MSISLRAFVPTVSVAAAAVAIRMAERWQRYEQYSPFWQVRPRVSTKCFSAFLLQTLKIKSTSSAWTASQVPSSFAALRRGGTGDMLPWQK